MLDATVGLPMEQTRRYALMGGKQMITENELKEIERATRLYTPVNSDWIYLLIQEIRRLQKENDELRQKHDGFTKEC